MTECAYCDNSGETATVHTLVGGSEEEQEWCLADCAKNDTTECEKCEELWDTQDMEDVRTIDGEEKWCPTCRESDAIRCSHCSEPVATTDTVAVYEGRRSDRNRAGWCPSCAENDTTECGSCDELFDENLNFTTVGDRAWCERCAEHTYYCEHCQESFPDSDDHSHEEEEDESEFIKKYHSASVTFDPIDSPWVKAQPVPLYFGVELEVEVPPGKDRDTYAEKIQDGMGELLAGMEEDGSLSHGFEIITQPAGLDTHRETWCKVPLAGLKSHDTTTCGLHVHFTKAAAGKLTLGKMLLFVNDEHNTLFLEQFARRSMTNRYAKKVPGMKATSGIAPRSDRYEALNTTGGKTVEFRLPKGTTKCTTILATLEFVYMLLRFCEASSPKGLTVPRFLMTASDPHWKNETRFLRAYLVDRGLASAKDMGLPKIKSGTPPPQAGDADPRENPSRGARSYAEQALAEYRKTGE